ncbi:MAG: hypothetical protein KIT56_05960 [Gammaproteobacteria bacterium]|nr:hypothetical protein [Gammaproteobacteria bacterium]MCW5583414.1 hypothetical protein [Gammaproteobacteria bacterium]
MRPRDSRKNDAEEDFSDLQDPFNYLCDDILNRVLEKEKGNSANPRPDKIIDILNFFEANQVVLSNEALEARVYPILYESILLRLRMEKKQIIESDNNQPYNSDFLEPLIRYLDKPSFFNFINNNLDRQKDFYFSLFNLAVAKTEKQLSQEIDDTSLIIQVFNAAGIKDYSQKNKAMQYILTNIRNRRLDLIGNREEDISKGTLISSSLFTDSDRRSLKNRLDLSSQEITPPSSIISSTSRKPTSSLSEASGESTPCSSEASKESTSHSSEISSHSLGSSKETVSHISDVSRGELAKVIQVSSPRKKPDNHSNITFNKRLTIDENGELVDIPGVRAYLRWKNTEPEAVNRELNELKIKLKEMDNVYKENKFSTDIIKILKRYLSLSKYIEEINEYFINLKQAKKMNRSIEKENEALINAIKKYVNKKNIAMASRNFTVILDEIINNPSLDEENITKFKIHVNKFFSQLKKFYSHYSHYQKLKVFVKQQLKVEELPPQIIESDEKILDDVINKIYLVVKKFPGLEDKIRLGLGRNPENIATLSDNLIKLWKLLNIHIGAYVDMIEDFVPKPLKQEFDEFMKGKKEISDELDAILNKNIRNDKKNELVSLIPKINKMNHNLQEFMQEAKVMEEFIKKVKIKNIMIPVIDTKIIDTKSEILKLQNIAKIYQSIYRLNYEYSDIKTDKVNYEKKIINHLRELYNLGKRVIKKNQKIEATNKKASPVARLIHLSRKEANKIEITSNSNKITEKFAVKFESDMDLPSEPPPVPPIGVHVIKSGDEYLKKIHILLRSGEAIKDKIIVKMAPIEKIVKMARNTLEGHDGKTERMRAAFKDREEAERALEKSRVAFKDCKERIRLDLATMKKIYGEVGSIFKEIQDGFFGCSGLRMFSQNNIDRNKLGDLFSNPENYFIYLEEYKRMGMKLAYYVLCFKKLTESDELNNQPKEVNMIGNTYKRM